MTVLIMTLVTLICIGLLVWILVAGIAKAVRQSKERKYYKAQTKRLPLQ